MIPRHIVTRSSCKIGILLNLVHLQYCMFIYFKCPIKIKINQTNRFIIIHRSESANRSSALPCAHQNGICTRKRHTKQILLIKVAAKVKNRRIIINNNFKYDILETFIQSIVSITLTRATDVSFITDYQQTWMILRRNCFSVNVLIGESFYYFIYDVNFFCFVGNVLETVCCCQSKLGFC